MKLIYIHIPKTAGSSLSNYLFNSTKSGLWLRNGELDAQLRSLWDLDYLAGHFTRDELFSWIKREGLDYSGTRLVTIIRHPLEQLHSNLSFPFELQRRGVKIQEPWMLDMLRIDLKSPNELCNFLNRHRWLLNLQWQYIVSGLSFEEAIQHFAHISIFPSLQQSIIYAASTLTAYPSIKYGLHENRSLSKSLDKNLFHQNGLRELLINEHRLDMELYISLIRERLSMLGISSALQFVPNTPDELFQKWLSS